MLDYINAVPKGFWGLALIALIGWTILNVYWFCVDHKEESLGKRIWLAIQLNLALPFILSIGLVFAIFTIPFSFSTGSLGIFLFLF